MAGNTRQALILLVLFVAGTLVDSPVRFAAAEALAAECEQVYGAVKTGFVSHEDESPDTPSTSGSQPAVPPPEAKPDLLSAAKAFELERQGKYRAALDLLQQLRDGDFFIPASTEIIGETEDGGYLGEWVDARPIGNRRLAMMRCNLQLGKTREAVALAWQTVEAETADASAFACIVQHPDLQGGFDQMENRLREILKKNQKHLAGQCLDYLRVQRDLADGKYPALVDRIRCGAWNRRTELGPGGELKEYIAVALARRTREALPDLVKALAQNGDAAWIVYCLGRSGNERAIAPLFNYLLSVKNSWARKETAFALSHFGDKAASYAIARLESEKPVVRERAAQVLSACSGDALQKADPGSKHVLRALRDPRNHGKDGWVNIPTFLLRAIAATRNHDYLDEVRRIKKEAGSFGAPDDVQYVYTLAFLGDTSVVPDLIAGLSGKYHHFARPALEAVTGKSFQTQQEWQKWWSGLSNTEKVVSERTEEDDLRIVPPDQLPLPGTQLSVEKALKQPKVFAVVCEATSEARASAGADLWPDGVAGKWQVFRVAEVLGGKPGVANDATFDYYVLDRSGSHERAIRKGERVIWIARPWMNGDVAVARRPIGLKALPDTPENRAVVKARSAKITLGGTEAPLASQSQSKSAKVDSFVRGDARIALGMTKDQVREQLSKGRIRSHKVYCFRKPPPNTLERDVWVLFYGPEVPGMGRLDVLRVTFTDDKASNLEIETTLCP